jgi:hypothetical protein
MCVCVSENFVSSVQIMYVFTLKNLFVLYSKDC